MRLHPLPQSVSHLPSPAHFTYPFCYTPHPLCVAAAGEVRRYLATRTEWTDELRRGKMFGVLVVESGQGRGFLASFSGTLGGDTMHDYFVPPVFDLMADGCHFQQEERLISDINARIGQLRSQMVPSPLRRQMDDDIAAYRATMHEDKARRDKLRASLSADELQAALPSMVRQSQYQKAQLRRLRRQWEQRIAQDEAHLRELQSEADALCLERSRRSAALQQWLFGQFVFLDANGEERNLKEIFHPLTPPSGAGECCAPRLLQAAYRMGAHPVCMAEFWVGGSPEGELRLDGRYYPSCNSRCKPILGHMLRGLDVEPSPLSAGPSMPLGILYHDARMAAVYKPCGMLSVPGKGNMPSVQSEIVRLFPHAQGPIMVHRLDMDTAGVMAVALTWEAYHTLQQAFVHRRVSKTYRALLEHAMPIGMQGTIDLPLRPDVTDRPRQTVDISHGRHAVTHYRVLDNIRGHALVELKPLTGRTHQLRVHCAHPQGLGNPILGDRLYGTTGERLHLLAQSLEVEGRRFEINVNSHEYELFIGCTHT